MTVEQFSRILKSLAKSFPNGGFLTANGEFIANKRTNAYFCLTKCDTYIDVCCSVLEWLSRDCFKSMPFQTDGKNEKYHSQMLDSVNDFLGTRFTKADIEIIYQKLGNAINHELAIEFVKSDYDMEILK